MPDSKAAKEKYIALGICLLLLLLIFAVIAPKLSAEETYSTLTEKLDDKREGAIEISAALAGASVAIAAVPGDATTPIADQIAGMNSYLIVVIGAIMLEKYMLPLIGMLSGYILFPIAIILIGIYFFTRHYKLLRTGILIALLGVIILLVIPTGILIGDKIDKAYGLATLSENIQNDLNDITSSSKASDNDDEDENEKSIIEKAGDFLTDAKESITEGVSIEIEKIKLILGDLLDAVAALIISTCIIPILMCLVFYWLAKFLFSYIIGLIGIKDAANKLNLLEN